MIAGDGDSDTCPVGSDCDLVSGYSGCGLIAAPGFRAWSSFESLID